MVFFSVVVVSKVPPHTPKAVIIKNMSPLSACLPKTVLQCQALARGTTKALELIEFCHNGCAQGLHILTSSCYYEHLSAC